MVIGRVARRSARAEHVSAVVGKANAQAALDLLELVDFAWHDCYGQLTPPDEVIDDILICSQGDLASMVRAARQAVEDFRDLRLRAERAPSREPPLLTAAPPDGTTALLAAVARRFLTAP